MAKLNYLYRYSSEGRRKVWPNLSYGSPKKMPNLRYLSIMVWNIFKQQRLDWLSLLEEHAKNRHFVLLQEAHSNKNLIDFATSHFLVSDQVPAIEMPTLTTGVMTLSKTAPIYCQAFRTNEPLLRLPKSALITLYQLHHGEHLMVINVHAVNFSLGVTIFTEQIRAFTESIQMHTGPIIFAGDFNTWSRQRLYLLYQFARRMGLKAVHFKADYRKNIFNYPLDFVFYRGLNVHSAEVVKTAASDHNPLLVTFELPVKETPL